MRGEFFSLYSRICQTAKANGSPGLSKIATTAMCDAALSENIGPIDFEITLGRREPKPADLHPRMSR